MRIAEFFHFKKKRVQFALTFWVVVALLSFPHAGLAKTVFYGVGNDGYFNDVIGLRTALSRSIGADEFSSYTYSNLSGSEIYNTTLALEPSLNRDDTLVWYYSGHGTFFRDDSFGDESRPGTFALDSYDEAIGLQGNSDLLSDDELATAMNSFSNTGASILTIVDMCYAGGFVGGTSDLNTISDLTFMGSSSDWNCPILF